MSTMHSEESDAFWDESNSKVDTFSFDDDHCEFVNLENIEKEKQKAIGLTYNFKSSRPALIKANTITFDAARFNTASEHRKPSSLLNDESTSIELNASEAIKNLVLGRLYILEPFKAHYQKKQLLTEAISWYDGNAILTVVLFLKQTLSQNIFYKLLIQQPIALNHYLKYLKIMRDHSTLNDILVMLGRNEDAFLTSYQIAIASQHPETKIGRLTKFCNAHKNSLGIEFFEDKIWEQVRLLERQLPIEQQDLILEKEGKNLIFQTVKRQSLPNMSVVDTLYYCCLYHFYLPENNFASPLFIRKAHQLTDKQFVWTALNAFTRLELWKDIDALFQTKSWLGTNTIRSAIGFEKVVISLHMANAPMEMIAKYMSLVETAEKRLILAKKLKYYNIAVDTLVLMRDRTALLSYSAELIPNSREHRYALESLKASSIKWKN